MPVLHYAVACMKWNNNFEYMSLLPWFTWQDISIGSVLLLLASNMILCHVKCEVRSKDYITSSADIGKTGSKLNHKNSLPCLYFLFHMPFLPQLLHKDRQSAVIIFLYSILVLMLSTSIRYLTITYRFESRRSKNMRQPALLINIPLVTEGRKEIETVLLTFNFWKALNVKVLGGTF